MTTLGDIIRAYVKPSLGGRIVLRKRTTNQQSARVAESKQRVALARPALEAHRRCIEEGKAVKKMKYVFDKDRGGYVKKEVEVCPIDEFRKYLKIAMEETHGKK
jgi:hypothetical protein